MDSFKVDFICAGFQKCATTTIDTILRQHSRIMLPAIKEIHLDGWYDKSNKKPLKIIEKKFFNYKGKNKKIGIVDPEFENNPSLVSKFIAKDIKIIFIMRNPVDRLFSFYKMALFLGYPRVFKSTLSGKEITKVRRSFGRYVREEMKKNVKGTDIQLGNYIDIIMEFLKYHDKKDMLFIFFEEYVKDPEKYMNQILDFLNLPHEKMDSNIWDGKGNLIARNRCCFKLSNKMNLMREKIRCNPDSSLWQFQFIDTICNGISKLLTTQNKETMSENTRRLLEKYYEESKMRLEEYLNKDLSDLWF